MRTKTLQTVESLSARTEEIGECLVWTGYQCNGVPQVSHGGKMVPVRRLLMQLQGKTIFHPYSFAKCKTELCVHPEHIGQRSQKAQSTAMAKEALNHKAKKSKAQVIARRQRADIKMDMGKVREIRASDESGYALARKYGVSRTLVNKIKRGIYWRDYSNPFAGLGG